jgi:hypothetical protein
MSRDSKHQVEIATYAQRFIHERLAGFEKDMQICLTSTPRRAGVGNTHAYFPALIACCGILEFFSALYHGNVEKVDWQKVAQWSERFLPQPDYNRETMRILVKYFRHSVAHRGIATGVWIDRDHGGSNGRRMTWKIHADAIRPACLVAEENALLVNDPPWPCPYTHRVHVHLKGLQVDIRKATNLYCEAISNEVRLQNNFESVMRQLYPK